LNYERDEEMARASASHMKELLQAVASLTGYESIYLVGSGIGGRILVDALSELADSGYSAGSVKELVLAAPDIDTLKFRSQIQLRILRNHSLRTTVYVSTNDFSLKLAERIREFPRLGDPIYQRYVQDGVDVVDISAISPKRRVWGHSYIWDDPRVVRDLSKLLTSGKGASSRELTPVAGPASQNYWVLD
jgi:esterase/lipase superfamily enzyme